MKRILLTVSVILAANFAFAQATPSASSTGTAAQAEPAGVDTETSSASKATPGEPATSGGTIMAPNNMGTKSWRNKMKFQAYYGVWGDVGAVNYGDYSGNGVDLFVQAARDIGKGQSIALRVNGAQNQSNENPRDQYETVLADPQVIYKNPYYGSALRLSFPVMETSRDSGRHELRYNGGADVVDTGKFTIGVGQEVRAYGYTEDQSGQRMARGRFIVSPSYKFSDRLATLTNVVYDVRWNHQGQGYGYLEGGNVDDVTTKKDPRNLDRRANLELGLSINAIPGVLLIEPYVSQLQRVDGDDAWTFLNPDTTGYNLEFTINM